MAELTLDQQKAVALASARARAAESTTSGSQPSFSQSLMSSPVGRFAHDALLPIIEGPARLLSKIDPTGGMVGPMLDKGEKSYQDALAASRNTPGYAAARSQADAIQAGKGSGLTDQVIAPFVPSLAGATGGLFGGSMDAANASADAATDALKGYRAANPVSSTIAQVGGGFLGAPELPALPALSSRVVPTISDLKTAAKAAYDKVDNSGQIISGPAYDTMAADLQAKLANEGVDKTLHPNALAAFSRVQGAAGQPITFKGIDTMRRVAGDAIGASATNKADQRMAHIVQDHIDDFVNGLQPGDLVAGQGAADPAATVSSLNEARDLYRRSAQASTIQRSIDRAQLSASNLTQSGMENALRTEFRSLAKNDRAMARLDPDVQDAVKSVVKGGPVSNLLRQVGKYAPHGPVAAAAGGLTGMSLAGPEAGFIGAAALPLLGEAARVGATRMTKSAVQRTLDRAALGRGATAPLPNPPLQLPQLTNRSAIPLGLFGSSYQTQNQ